MNRVLNVLNGLSPVNVIKDAHTLFFLSALVAYPFSPEATEEPLTAFMVASLVLVPLAAYWTPIIQKWISFRELSDSRSKIYIWLMYPLMLIPVFGFVILMTRLMIYYDEESIEDKLNIRVESGRDSQTSDDSQQVSAVKRVGEALVSFDYSKWSRVFGAAGVGGIKGMIIGGFVGATTFLIMAYFEMPVLGSFLAVALAFLTYIGQMLDSAQTKKEKIEHRRSSQ